MKSTSLAPYEADFPVTDEPVTSASLPPVISIRNLRKSYGSVEAVKDISFDIPRATIFGLLGPNGAGKTTTIEIIEGIRSATSGAVRVCGMDPYLEGVRLRHVLGAQLQSTALNSKIRVKEAFKLFASFYRDPMNVDELLSFVGLQHRSNNYFESLSGGERQRLALGLALIGNPRVLLLDEPTASLDAQIRRDLHQLILDLREQGRTILLTTHYIEEAEKLCDLVGVIDEGQLHVIGRPCDLVRELGQGDRLDITLRFPVAPKELEELAGVSEVIGSETCFSLRGRSGGKMLASLSIHANMLGNEVMEAKVVQSTLEDVYLKITGRRMEA